ncbi:Caudovirales tail fiber assembly protein, lambda gpK [compost metagenome]
MVSEQAQRRALADAAIAPLQDAVELDEATESEAALLIAWKRYRVALSRLADQEGYPNDIDWPAPPACSAPKTPTATWRYFFAWRNHGQTHRNPGRRRGRAPVSRPDRLLGRHLNRQGE